MANLNNFVDTMPNGYLSLIGSEGVALSGGQTQRILIARAIYKSPDILILDEATSSLDSINENIIVSRLKELSYKRTVIIIAHRLNSIRRADVIFVLKQGCIVEEGTHEELLEKDCSYAKLLNNQLSS